MTHTLEKIVRRSRARLYSDDKTRLKLREHLASAVTVMQLSDTYDDFITKLNKVKPRFDEFVRKV